MINISIVEFLFCLWCMVVLGIIIACGSFILINKIKEYKKNKDYILEYISLHKRSYGIPSSLIYDYLSKEEKQDILERRGEF